MDSNINFSLIMCTLGRTECIYKLLDSLKNQGINNFELIIVDQNKDNRIEVLLNQVKYSYEIIHIKSDIGLSYGRNKALKIARGRIIGFPDDDCYYSDNLLTDVLNYFDNNKIDLLSIKMENSIKNGRVIQDGTKNTKLKKTNIFNLVASISIFIKKAVLDDIGGFDENLGLGSTTIFKGSEDYELPLRAIIANYNCFYTKDIIVYHPWDDKQFVLNEAVKKASYSGGASEIYVLNKANYSKLYIMFRLIRRFAIIFYFYIKGNTEKANQNKLILKGMWDYRNYEI